MAEVDSAPLDATKREPQWVSPRGAEEVFEEAAPAFAQDMDELEATRGYKRAMLNDAASSVSFRKGGAGLPRAAQIRVLETELSRAAAERDLLRKVALTAEARQNSEEDRAAELEGKSKAADAELAALEAWMDRQHLSRKAQPPDKQKELAKLTTQAQVAREAATMQRTAAEREHHVHLHAKREADCAERDHHADAEILETLAGEKAEQEAFQESEVSKRVSTEEGVAGKMAKHHQARAKQRGDARLQLHRKAQAQLKAAKAARGAAAERSNLLVRDAAPALQEVVRMKDEAHAQRVECVLQLKADTEAAAALIRGANERRSAERLQEEEDHEAEKDQLTAKGLNPYKVFKQRAVDSRAVREEQKQENRIRLRKQELAERLKKEEALRIKHDAKARLDKDQEQRMRDELGRHVVDARNREFLRARTVDGTDVLDPSGRSFRIEPSQVTTIKDAAFGLGYHPRKTPAMAAAVVDLVASKPQHAGVGAGEFARLVPRDPTEVDSGAGGVSKRKEDRPDVGRAEAAAGVVAAAKRPQNQHQQQQQQLLEDLVPPAGKKSLPGTDVPFVVDNSDEAAADCPRGAGGSADVGGGGGGRVGGAGRALTVFEIKALQKARARQRDRMEAGEPQVAAGRTFKDRPSFVAKPERVVFKDFVVGKVHRRRVVLTNVSLTFNTLKVLGISDEINRFFEVTYAKPGRLSAGMTCAVDIVFTPKVEEDIFTELPIRTQTGPLSIPVECTARRVKPKLSTTLVVFRGTVMGEKETARVAVTNEGVVSTRFTITTASSSHTAHPGDSRVGTDPPPDSDGHRSGLEGATRRAEAASPRPDGRSKEAELLEKASAVGVAGMKYPEGKGAIEVVDGGGELAGYGSAEIVVEFAPLTVGKFRTVKTIRFEGSQQEFQLVVEASSAPVAVFPEEACTDLRCCVFGKLYLKKVRICNRGKIAMKAVARVPPSLRGCASFSPDMGFVQPGSFFDFGLRFRPNPAGLARCAQDGWGFVSAASSSSATRNCSSSGGDGQASSSPSSPEHEDALTRGGQRKPGVLGYEGEGEGDGNAEEEEEAEEAGAGRTTAAGAGGGMIVVPLRFDVPGQALPARSVVRARLTGWAVEVGWGGAGGYEVEAAAGGAARGEGRAAVVDFGGCFVGQSVSRRIPLRSTSLLPVKFGFVGGPAEVDVQPADGFGVLLPGEERWVEATFSPVSAVSHDSTMSFRTSLGQTTVVRCRGYGVEPVVRLSHTVLSLAPACLGDAVTTSVFVTNVSAVEQNLEFFVPEPELSFLKVCPSVVRLPPRQGARVEVSFCPPKALRAEEGTLVPADKPHDADGDDDGGQEEQPGEDAHEAAAGGAARPPASGKASGKKGGDKTKAAASSSGKNANVPTLTEVDEGEDGAGAEVAAAAAAAAAGAAGAVAAAAAGDTQRKGQADNCLPLVPLYAGALDEGGLVDCEEEGEGGENGAGRAHGEPWSRHGRWRVPCFLKSAGKVHSAGGSATPGAGGEGGRGREAHLPPLALEVTTVIVERVLSVDQDRIDFGQLAVGTKAEAFLRVKNAGEDVAPLEGGGLNSVGPFEVVNAFRAIPARGGSHRCVLQFRPERAGIVSETLILSSPSLGKGIRVRLRGEGVRPVLTMLPADGRLDMGHVLEGETVEREVKLRNDSVFPLRYATAPFGPRPPSNVNHFEAFALVPCEGGVPPGENVTVKAVFSPDRSRIWPLLGAFRIEARDQPDGGHVLRVRGRCLSRQVYVEAAPPGKNPGDRAAEATEDVLAAEAVEGRSSPPPTGLQSAAPPPPPIVLRFPKDDSNASREAAAGEKSPTDGGNVMRLVVGCLSTNDPKKSSAGSFEVELSPEAKEKGYFRLTPDKGTVSPGTTAEVSCAFEPPPRPPRMPGPAGGKGGTLEVGQWYKTTMLVHLRGGYRPPGASETLTVSVQLEGFVIA